MALKDGACRRLLRGAVKGISDQSQRRIKTSAAHFASISPTLPEHCASAVEVNREWLFATLHTETHSPPLFPFSLCLLLDMESALIPLPLSVSPQHLLSGVPAHIQYA